MYSKSLTVIKEPYCRRKWVDVEAESSLTRLIILKFDEVIGSKYFMMEGICSRELGVEYQDMKLVVFFKTSK